MSLIIVSLSVVLAIAFAVVWGYVIGAKRKNTATVENPVAGYRDPAMYQTEQDVSVSQRLQEMPKSVMAAIAVLGVLLGPVLAMSYCPTLFADPWRAVTPRYEVVPEGYRGVIVEGREDRSPGAVLEPGRYLVWLEQRIELVRCQTDTTEEYEAWTRTTDGQAIGLRFSGQARFACTDPMVWRVVQERGYWGEPASTYGAWDFYVTPAVQNAFLALIEGRSVQYVYQHRDEIVAAATRRIDSLQLAEVDIASIELILPKGLSDNGQSDRPVIAQFELPSLEGWSTAFNEDRDEVVYTRHRPGVTIRVMTWPEAEGSPEHLIGTYAAGRSDRVGPPPTADASAGSSDDAWLISVGRRDGHPITRVIYGMRSRRPGVNLLFIETCENSPDCGFVELADLAYRIRPHVD